MVEARIGCAVRASFGGISRILFPLSRDGDHLSHSVSRVPSWGATITRGVLPAFAGKSGQATLPLLCLAPHGVFRASRITPRAVSSYLAFSPLPALFSKNRRCLFCDTFRHCSPESFRRCSARVFYAACCRMVFGLSSSESFDSPAIICHRRLIYHIGRRRKPR